MKKDVGNDIKPILKSRESDYVRDGVASDLKTAFNKLSRKYAQIGVFAEQLATEFVGNAERENRNRFIKSMNRAIGVDINFIIQNENLEDALAESVEWNVSLIRTIPTEYFRQIESIIYQGVLTGNTSGSMISQISELNGQQMKRARLIARDQSSKLNSNLNEKRQTNLGIEEYIWQTSRDGERVRESHRKKDGQVFRWDSPPEDTGHPGQDIQCRCVAIPVINL